MRFRFYFILVFYKSIAIVFVDEMLIFLLSLSLTKIALHNAQATKCTQQNDAMMLV